MSDNGHMDAFAWGVRDGARAKKLGQKNPGEPYQTVRGIPLTTLYNLGLNVGFKSSLYGRRADPPGRER